jgi:hypothetical protein
MAGKNWKDMHTDATTVIQGEFPLVIDSAEATKTQGGKDMIKCKVKVESGIYAHRLIYHNFTITEDSPAAMRMFFSQMAILGVNDKWWSANPNAPVSEVAKTIEGRRFIGKVGVKTWMGADREEIQEFKPALGAATAKAQATAGLSRGTVGAPMTTPATPSAVATELQSSGADGATVAGLVGGAAIAGAVPSTPPPADPAF